MSAPTVSGADPADRVVRFSRHWHLPQDPDSYRLLAARLGPAVSRRQLAALLAVAVPPFGLYAWAAFSDSVPLRLGAAVTLSLLLAGITVSRTVRDARRDAALSRALPRHVTRSRPLRVADLLGPLETRLLLAGFTVSAAGCLATAATRSDLRAIAGTLAAVVLALAAVAFAVLRLIASRPTVADTPAALQVDLALRRNQATGALQTGFYAMILPMFTISIAQPRPAKVLAASGLVGAVCYLVLALRLNDHRDGLLAEERGPR